MFNPAGVMNCKGTANSKIFATSGLMKHATRLIRFMMSKLSCFLKGVSSPCNLDTWATHPL
eukprot:10803580-Alexandrium_andersonii.AAC.1